MTTFSTFATATFATGNIVVVQSAENMIPGLPISFTGNTFGNVTANATFYIGNITFGFPTSNITLTSLPGGAVYALANGSGNMTATFSQGGQQIIPTVPPGEPLNQAFDAVNVNFDQIFAAGPVGSNIQIDQNTILTLNTNGNLVLNPNGIGNVIANAHVIPDQDRVRNLGAFALRWNTVYAQNFVGNGGGISNITVSNISNGSTNITALANANITVTVAGTANVAVFTPNGLLINGTVSSTGNITAPTFIGNLIGNITGNIDAGGANTQVQFNNNDLLAGSPGFTFNKTTNAVGITGTVTAGNMVTGGTVSAVGNISANYYFGNGSQLTGITADNVNADDLTGNTLSGNVIFSSLTTLGNLVSLSVTGTATAGNLATAGYVSATGNITGNYILGNGALLTGVITSVANINNGNSNVTISGPGSNVTVGVGGTSNVVVVSPTDVTITGNLTVTGNATLSGNILGDRIQNGNTQIDIQTAGGNANVSVGGVANVAVFATTGVFVTGVNSVSGNITGGNILTGGTVSAVGNITGNYFFGNGSQLTGITADNVNADDLIGNTLSGNVLFSSLTTVGNLVDLSVVGTTTTGNLATAGFVSAAGNITAPTFFGNLVGNITGNIDAGGANTEIQFNDNNLLAGSAAFTFNKTSNLVTISGNVTAGNVTSLGIVTANLGVYGDIYTTSIDSADSSAVIVTPDMILLASLDVNQDITVGNIVIPSYGNITVGNVRIANLANPVFNQDAVTKQYVDSAIGNVLPIITNQTIDPDGSSLTYTLDQSTTAVGIFVTINGISQTPNDSYTVVDDQITFAEALLTTDVVQIRFLSGTSSGGGGGVQSSIANGTSNVNLATANGNATITANAVTYTFGTNSTLTLPGGSRLRPLGSNLDIFAGTGSYVQLINSDESSSMGVDGAGGYIVTAGGTWGFSTTGNLTAPGNVSAVGNITGAYVKGNGSELTNLPAPTVTQDISSNGAMSIMTYDGVIKYVSYATIEPSSGNIAAGNISTTGNVTGNYFVGNGSQLTGIVTNTGNVTFSGEAVIGTGTSNTVSGLYLAPDPVSLANDLYLRVRGNILDEPTHIHFDTGNNQYYNQFIGDDNKYIQLANTGNIVINTNNYAGNTAQWTFGTDGSLTLPGANVDYTIATQGGYITVGNLLIGQGGALFNSNNDSWALYGNISDPGATIFIPSNADAGNGTALYIESQQSNVEIRSGSGTWNFGNTSNLTLPLGGVVSEGASPTGLGNTIALTPAGGSDADQQLLVYPTGNVMEGNHLHLTTGNLYNTELYLGNDNLYVKLANTGNVVINSYDGVGNAGQWTFGTDSNLTTPGGMIINGNINTLGSQTALLQPTDDLPLAFIASGANGSVISYWAEDIANLMSSNIAAIYTPLQGTQTVRIVTGSNGGNIAIYDFDPDGMFTAAAVCATGNVYAGNVSASGNVTVGGNLSVTGNIIGNVVTRFESFWTVPTGNSTQSFTVTPNETYYLWVDCNIPNGILVWNATATITNTNVPVVGDQYAWVYNGGGTPIDFTSIPNQFIGTANTIVRSSVAPSATTNRFDFGINNASGNIQTIRYGWVRIS